MAEPTNTRTILRRALCSELHMPFIRRTGGQSLVGASPTTTLITDTALFFETDLWNGHWFYSVTSDSSRKIIDTRGDTNQIVLEYPITIEVAGQAYEIHSVFNAAEIHGAINRAIDDAFPAFFDYVTDETIVLCENTLKYSLTGLTSLPWQVAQIKVEHNETVIQGTATSGAVGLLTDTGASFGSVVAGWLVSIYGGTGAGQLRTVQSATGATITPSVVFTTAPDSTSKYKVWNPNSQTTQWERVVTAGFDAKEYPSVLYFGKNFPASEGLRIRLEYSCRPAALTIEGSTTIVPKEFIIHKALSYLFGQKVNDNRADRNRFANLEEYRRQLAEQYRASRAFQHPGITVWQEPSSLLSSSTFDPLG